MQTRNISRNWTVAAAVAAMLAASSAGVRAQDTMTPPTAPAPMAPNTTTGTMPVAPMAPAPMSGDMSAAPMSADTKPVGVIDYTVLSNPFYNYVDLKQAKTRGMSDSQVATIAKIAKKSYVPFETIARAIDRGETFPGLATQYGLKLTDVYDSESEKTDIANYITAYESLTPKSTGMMGEMSKPMMGGEMSTEKPMDMSKPMETTTQMTSPPMAMATMDIVDTAMASKNLTTLVKALQLAGLVETLKGAGPFTVFAPDDKAFSKLPAGELDALMADPAKLKMVLTYHVIPASVDAATAMSMTSPTSPPTVEGATLQVTKGRRNKLMINDATVTKGDIHASNGIIHIINKVLMPPMDTTTTPMAPDATAPAAPMAPDTTAPAAPAVPAQ